MDYKNAKTLQEVFDRMDELSNLDIDTDEAERTAKSLLTDCVLIFGVLTGKEVMAQDITGAFHSI